MASKIAKTLHFPHFTPVFALIFDFRFPNYLIRRLILIRILSRVLFEFRWRYQFWLSRAMYACVCGSWRKGIARRVKEAGFCFCYWPFRTRQRMTKKRGGYVLASCASASPAQGSRRCYSQTGANLFAIAPNKHKNAVMCVHFLGYICNLFGEG